MNIAVDIRCLMQKKYSGVAEYTNNLLKNLFVIDKKNQYKLFYNSSQNLSQILPRFTANNVKVLGFKYPNKLFNFSLKFLKYPNLDQLVKDIDIFFIPNNNFLALSSACQKIITVHDLSFEIYPQFYSSKRKLWHHLINPKHLISQCQKIIADSQNTKNDLINYYKIPGSKIRVIHLGLDHELYKPLDKNLPKFSVVKEKYNLPNKFILFLGTLEPRKNIEGIIEVFNLLKHNFSDLEDLHLIIAGQKGWRYQQIFNLASQSPWQKQINFLGYVSAEDKPFLYNLAELFLFPSFYEGFGLPPLEAQASGTPVIAGLNSSFPEVLQDSAFLVKPDHLEEITSAVRQVMVDFKLKEDLIAKGLLNAQRFSWSKCAQETLDYLTTNN